MKKITLPAGRYWIGDPCYVVHVNNHPEWVSFLDHGREIEGLRDGSFIGDFDGHQVIAFSTWCGDGMYEDNRGYSYPVDAGLIGIVSADARLPKTAVEDGHFHDFDAPFECYNDDGNLYFGHVFILT